MRRASKNWGGGGEVTKKKKKRYGPSSVDFAKFSFHIRKFEANILDIFFREGLHGACEDLSRVRDSKELGGAADVQ